MVIDISSYSKADVLCALYNGCEIPAIVRAITSSEPLKIAPPQAVVLLGMSDDLYFDYIDGRSLKVDLSKNEVDLWLYDRDNGGEGAGLRAIKAIASPNLPEPNYTENQRGF